RAPERVRCSSSWEPRTSSFPSIAGCDTPEPVDTARGMDPKPAAETSGYPARDVARLLGLTLSQITGLVRAGCLEPQRGPRRELRFSFRDLVLLRTSKDLIARMPA